jgi:hypothetical protein
MLHYSHSEIFREAYDRHYFNYWPTNNERLEDKPANNKLTKTKVLLFFLVKKSYMAASNTITILLKFYIPNTSVYTKPQKYNKLEL